MSQTRTIKNHVRTFLRTYLGIEVSWYQANGSAQNDRYSKDLLHEADPFFNELYERGSAVTETDDVAARYSKRRERFYNLMQLFMRSTVLDGSMAECGCWKGLSSFMMCHYLQQVNPAFKGENYHILDSFQGLSEPTDADVISDRRVTKFEFRHGQPAGAYSASLEHVQRSLAEFPEITYHPGWLPESLENVMEARYRFVHIDLDLHDPIKGAVEYFYPRMVPGGTIVFDDYGSLYWPGAKKAIDDYCAAEGIRLLVLSTGQAVVWKD